ncbi:GNAT family N-acetyltransferase [Humibacter sp. RRB41]|uniref:GNAT family N-acetyltransferase n=1 Tax=Humibacter sp. RRB41 TaxID=2919946 RepID=UPI001FA9B0F0|nr:GNAT family N-acetyltransferase [Humibacter sp. RRB41]
MGITIREPAEGDFFSWLALYEDYATFYERALTDQGALLVWSWLTDPAYAERGLVAVDDNGSLVGLVHFHQVPRPLDGDHALHIDDLFILEEHREQGYGRALIDAVGSLAAESGVGVVQWLAKTDNTDARAFYDEIADASELVVYRLRRDES